jgi:lipid-A-disaccharide synthase
MLEAAPLVARQRAGTQFVVTLAPTRKDEEAARIIEQVIAKNRGSAKDQRSADERGGDARALTDDLRVVGGETRETLSAADAAAVASGTATLEAALTETPLVVVYRESPLNWHALGSLIRVEHYGLVNLVAGERIAAELMQYDFTPAALAREMITLLDPTNNSRARERLRTATARLGDESASLRAADAILRALRTWKGKDEG